MVRVLIAEDNAADLLLISDLCKGMDFEPLVAENRLAAVETVRASPPELVLLDLQAPVINGLAMAIELRGLRNVGEQMMIIGLNSTSPAEAAACQIAGMNQILARPLQPERLLAALRAVRAPLNQQAMGGVPDQPDGAPGDETLQQRLAESFGPMAADTPFARLHYINTAKLAQHFGQAWRVVVAHIELTTRLIIEAQIGESAAYKRFDELDYVLMTPGLTPQDCAAKCQAIAQEICRTLATDESGSKFHIRTQVFSVAPGLADASAMQAARADAARAANPDILTWTALKFWPVWDTQRRKFPLHSIRADRAEDGALLPEAGETIEAFGLNAYHEALDVSMIADLAGRLEGYDTLEQPRLLTLPLHFSTLGSFAVMARYLRYIEQIPKKIRERLVIEIHGVPKEIRAVQIAELQKPLLGHCLHTMLAVSPLCRNINVLSQMSNQIVGVELAEDAAEVEAELAALKQFAMQAKQAGLTVAASMVRNRAFRDWGLTSCRYVSGAAIAPAQASLNPSAKFIA